MNYFELFELPLSLNVDRKALSSKYFALQKKYHPDFFSNASEDEQAEVLEKSSLINKAYKTFNNSGNLQKEEIIHGANLNQWIINYPLLNDNPLV